MAVTLKFLNFKHKSVESLTIKKLQWVKWEEVDLEHERLEEGGCPKLYWTEKHMHKRGVPPKKKLRPDNLASHNLCLHNLSNRVFFNWYPS